MLATEYPAAQHTLVQLSDIHLVENRRPLYGALDTDAHLITMLERIEAADLGPKALVLSGDLADHGAPDAYRRLRDIVAPVAARLDVPVIWGMGNHDDRGAFRSAVLGQAASTEPVDTVTWLGDLRIVSIDSTVPGFHHGEIGPAQHEWLTEQLRETAPHGTILVMHHPPIASTQLMLQSCEFRGASRLAETVAGTDVRMIIAGHYHYRATATLAGIPVVASGALAYSQDLAVPAGGSRAQAGGQSAAIIRVYPETVVHEELSAASFATVYEVTPEAMQRLASGQSTDLGLLNS